MKLRLPAVALLTFGLCSFALLCAGDQPPAPSKAVVQISVIDVDTRDGKPLPSFAGVRGQTVPYDDLSTLKFFALYNGLSLTITPLFSVKTSDGAAATVNDQTQIPYITLDGTTDAAKQTLHYMPVVSSLSATPHVNSDGTVSIEFTLTESKEVGAAWRELGVPTITTRSVKGKLTFRDGDTRAVYFPSVEGFTAGVEGPETHRAFLTLKLLPAVKG